MENLRESVIEQLEEAYTNDLVEVHNLYCSLIDDRDNEIQHNDLGGLQMLLGDGEDYITFALKVFHGDYNPNHDYVKLDGYANLESFNDPTEHICNSDMVDTIMENLREFEYLLDIEY